MLSFGWYHPVSGRLLYESQLRAVPCPVCGEAVRFGVPFCAQHSETKLGLCIHETTLDGFDFDGLFACRKFRKGQRVVQYHGDVMSSEAFDSRYDFDVEGHAPYAVRLTNGVVIDAASFRGLAAFANTHPVQNNCRIVQTGPERAHLVATKDVVAGQEFFADYGQFMDFSQQLFLTSRHPVPPYLKKSVPT